MEFSTTRVDSANLSISATIGKDDIEKNLERIAKELAKTQTIPGFRKGKVPAGAIKRFYGSRLVEDAEAEALRELLEAGQKEAGVDNSQIITEPTFSKFERVENGIEVDINISLRPTIELGDYLSFVPSVDAPEVTEAEVNERISDMLEKNAPFVEVDRAIENGDSVTFDFEGFIDGEAFDGGKAENYTLKVGSGNFIAGFEEQLVGLQKGDEKEISVTFPEEYHAENLKGKPALFKCKIGKVEIKEAQELNDEVADTLLNGEEPNEGESKVDALKRVTDETLKSEKLSKIYNDETKPQLREALAENYSFDLPRAVIDKEVEQRLNQEENQMTEAEIEEIKGDEEKLNELKTKVTSDAEKSVRTTFIIDALGQAEGVSVSDEELSQVITYEALMSGQDPASTIKKYEESGYLPLIKMSILEDKVLSKLLDKKMAN
jgi:trigger factor